MNLVFVGLVAAFVAGTAWISPAPLKRTPLTKASPKIIAPERYSLRDLDPDPETGEARTYDPAPKVDVVDERAGVYSLSWIGNEQRRVAVTYQRPDLIDVVVKASVTSEPEGVYAYTYVVESLPTSGQSMRLFVVQNFARDVRPEPREGLYVGRMGSFIKEFREGNWKTFHLLPEFNEPVPPGKSTQFTLRSRSLPRIVGCRAAGGELGLKGVGEHMPQELENVLPGYEAYPAGFTIGPSDGVASQGAPERQSAFVESLAECERLGWITRTAASWYAANVRSVSPERLRERLAADLKRGEITEEVVGLAQPMLIDSAGSSQS